jgi:DNA-binding transcriptional LysR family regulator
MNPRKLTPSMSLLLAFEAAARHQSFTRAAQELSTTQSAISKQVQALEALIDVELFIRTGRRIELTEVGAMYQRELAHQLAGIRNATLQAIAFRHGAGSLHLAVLPIFGTKWLLPRLSDFYKRHGQVQVHIHSKVGQIDLERSGMDAYIAVGDGLWPGCRAHLLMEERLVPIISPALRAAAALNEPRDLSRHLLLRVKARPENWTRWFAARGIPASRLRSGPDFELTSHLIQAVIAGIGVGLVPHAFVEDELRAGTVEIAMTGDMPDPLGYYLVYRQDRANYPPLAQFREWIGAQACEDRSTPTRSRPC